MQLVTTMATEIPVVIPTSSSSSQRNEIRKVKTILPSDLTSWSHWPQVDENMFKATQTCPSHISKECSLLRASSQFQYLEWTKVTWSDLRKPLYSGVASALYMLLQLRKTSQQMPGEVEGQASIWATLYRPGSSSLRFSEAAESVTSISQCLRPPTLVNTLYNI